MNITAGIYKGRKIEAPDEKFTRPTLSKTRMGIFNTLYSIMGNFEGKTFLDVFGGSGIMGLEALSRGFSHVKVYEINKKSAEIIKKNYEKLGIEVDLTIGDSLKFIPLSDNIYDVVYIDPPYNSGLYEAVLKIVKGKIVAVESSYSINIEKYELIKEKVYGSNKVTFWTPSITF